MTKIEKRALKAFPLTDENRERVVYVIGSYDQLQVDVQTSCEYWGEVLKAQGFDVPTIDRMLRDYIKAMEGRQ